MTQRARIIDGKRIASAIEAEVKETVQAIDAQGGMKPCLAVVVVGEDPASAVYVRNKGRACDRVGFASHSVVLPAETTEAALLDEIAQLNADPAVHGILVQLPLPKAIDERRILEAIDPLKDVDGFHPYNAGRLVQGAPTMVPATAAGVLELLKREGVAIAGLEAAVVGRSTIVGRPVAALLTNADATVTLCHSRTKDLPAVLRRADVVVAAVGRPAFITAEMIKPGAVVIDVGINRLPDGRLVGDVDFEGVQEVAGYLTPVPGGVGPMTIAVLLRNTLEAYRAQGN
ncbi:bifunctional methylenetetrahydrofolate dehydrogenase/methenyltetrahydrofolate cyclohydrolase FolD [bacterium]|nr:bifunctional methylenetetrahydrofolate dehydrogenase/methenyltetrahydrofolate cyclohydrolase FolD [bacterium]